MAAGKGTRLKSKRPKVLHEIGGRALLLHVIAAAKTVVPAERIYCIVGHEADRVKTAVAPSGVKFVMQEEQRAQAMRSRWSRLTSQSQATRCRNISSFSQATCRLSGRRRSSRSASCTCSSRQR